MPAFHNGKVVTADSYSPSAGVFVCAPVPPMSAHIAHTRMRVMD